MQIKLKRHLKIGESKLKWIAIIENECKDILFLEMPIMKQILD